MILIDKIYKQNISDVDKIYVLLIFQSKINNTDYNEQILKIIDKISCSSGLVTTFSFNLNVTEIKNKIPDVTNL